MTSDTWILSPPETVHGVVRDACTGVAPPDRRTGGQVPSLFRFLFYSSNSCSTNQIAESPHATKEHPHVDLRVNIRCYLAVFHVSLPKTLTLTPTKINVVHRY